MKDCDSFEKLSMFERILFIARVINIIKSNEKCFEIAEKIVRYGNDNGLLNEESNMFYKKNKDA